MQGQKKTENFLSLWIEETSGQLDMDYLYFQFSLVPLAVFNS